MQSIFDLLAPQFPSAALCASALHISRQAFQQAKARGRLSEPAAMRAAEILGISPADALLINATRRRPQPPISHPAPPFPPDPPRPTAPALYYVKCSKHNNKSKNESRSKIITHSIASQSQIDAVDLIKWVLSVAGIPADSPRFSYYVSRWDVPNKIRSAKSAGTFDTITSKCPAIDPAHIRLVPDAITQHAVFLAKYHTEKRKTEKSCTASTLAA